MKKLLTADQLNQATFIGIDAHPDSHTAVAINRFKEPKADLTFANSTQGIAKFREWLSAFGAQEGSIVVGIEGGGNTRHALVKSVLAHHCLLFEVNPLYTKHKRSFGTRGDKTDFDDARLIAGVLTTELEELPRITPGQVSSVMLRLKKAVWLYEEVTVQGARLQNQLHKLNREHKLTQDREEKQLLATIIKSRKGVNPDPKAQKTCCESRLTCFPEPGMPFVSRGSFRTDRSRLRGSQGPRRWIPWCRVSSADFGTARRRS